MIDALRTPYEIVLPAHGWPKGAFENMPPSRSYRLHYLRDTKYHLDAPDDTSKNHKPVARRGFWLKRLGLRIITFAETKLGKTRRKLVRRTIVAQESPGKLPAGTHHIVRGSIKGAELLERRLEKRKNILTEALFHREEWLSKWKAGAHIVGYANIGEIGFHWTPEEKKVFQRLWWWHPENPNCATIATEYHDTLALPSPDAAPPLP